MPSAHTDEYLLGDTRALPLACGRQVGRWSLALEDAREQRGPSTEGTAGHEGTGVPFGEGTGKTRESYSRNTRGLNQGPLRGSLRA